jgi:hypothetical protein
MTPIFFVTAGVTLIVALLLRVARLAPRERAIATIMASNWLIGLSES